MNEDFSSFIQDLDEGTELLMDSYKSREEAFTAHVLSEIGELLNCGDTHIIHYCKKDIANRIQGEIYGYAISDNEEVLTLFYTIYNTKSEIEKISNAGIQAHLNKLQGFYNCAIRGLHNDLEFTDEMYEPAKKINNIQDKITSVRLCLLSNYIISGNEIKNYRIKGKLLVADVWDLKKLYGNLHSMNDHLEINIDFVEKYKYTIPFIKMESDNDNANYKCVMAMFPAKLLYKLYEEYNTNLLFGNVRYFLGLKGKEKNNANVGILKTLREDKEKFLAYNNGITALAADIEYDEIGERTNITENEKDDFKKSDDFISMGIFKSISDFRIVNGGQTTATIFKAKNLNQHSLSLYGVYVPIKIIIIDKNVNDIAADITKYSNSQSKIKYSDFSVSNTYNVEMEKLSRNIQIPNENNDLTYWFFERLRGQYDNEKTLNSNTKENREYFLTKYPKDKKFRKEEIAKVYKSWNQEPADAVKGEGSNYDSFISNVIKVGLIPDENYYKETIALLIIYKFLLSRPENKIYKNAKATVIAYAIAYLNYISFNKIDLIKIWNSQKLSDSMIIFLNQLCNSIYKILGEIAEGKGSTILSCGKDSKVYTELCHRGPDCDVELIKGDYKD